VNKQRLKGQKEHYIESGKPMKLGSAETTKR